MSDLPDRTELHKSGTQTTLESERELAAQRLCGVVQSALDPSGNRPANWTPKEHYSSSKLHEIYNECMTVQTHWGEGVGNPANRALELASRPAGNSDLDSVARHLCASVEMALDSSGYRPDDWKPNEHYDYKKLNSIYDECKTVQTQWGPKVVGNPAQELLDQKAKPLEFRKHE